MLIWLVDLDGKIENLALMKLSSWHKSMGDTVMLKRGVGRPPQLLNRPDRIYASCIFRWNKHLADRLKERWGDYVVIGGSGYDATIKLSDQIENVQPDYTLYNQNRAIGFISRGCIRNCPWCVVPQKEGKLYRVSTAQEIVGNHKEVIFLDNNFLALPDHQDDLRWLAENKIKIDFNQGLDARLITFENAKLLATCHYNLPGKEKVRLALDHVGQKAQFEHAYRLLVSAGIKPHHIFVYCLIGFSGFESDVERLLYLRSLKVRVYPMGFRDLTTGEEPMNGWDKALYKKYRRLILRMPYNQSVWDDFKRESSAITESFS